MCVCVCAVCVYCGVCVCVCIAYGFTVHPLTQEVLDADDNPLANKYGEKMTRDIVQFVPLRQFKSKGGADFSLVSGQICEWVEWGRGHVWSLSGSLS